jgi:hypothetical protein
VAALTAGANAASQMPRVAQDGYGSFSDLGARNREVRFTPDIVAKVFLGWRTKILRAADAFYARRREGPYRFIQDRSRTSVVALKSDAEQRSPKINFREIFRVVRFSTFATVSANTGSEDLFNYLVGAG